MVDMPIKMAIEELRQRLADECEERICGQRRLERFMQNISLPAKSVASDSADSAGAGWWEMAASHLSSLEDRMVALSEKVKELTSAHNAVVLANGGESGPARLYNTETALEKLQEEVQHLHEDRLTLHQTEDLATKAKEQLKAQTAEVQQVFSRWESRFETLCSRVEAESSLRLGETKRRKESEQLLTSLLGDLGEIRKEFNLNTEAHSRACAKSGLIRWGNLQGGEEPHSVSTWVPGTVQTTCNNPSKPRPTPDWSRIKTEEVLFPPSPWSSFTIPQVSAARSSADSFSPGFSPGMRR